MSSEDITYYRQREITERERAATAPTEEIAEAHRILAGMYRNIIEQEKKEALSQGPRPAPHIVEPTRPDTLQ